MEMDVLYINNKYAITIENCNFKNNIGSEKGSIYIVPDENESQSHQYQLANVILVKIKLMIVHLFILSLVQKDQLKLNHAFLKMKKEELYWMISKVLQKSAIISSLIYKINQL